MAVYASHYSTMAEYARPQASPYRGRLLTCVVLMLDDTEEMFQVPVSHRCEIYKSDVALLLSSPTAQL